MLYAAVSASAVSTPVATPSKDPQRVQIMRTPDGRITVKGLMPGQQLVQFPDGKLQVLTTTQVAATATSTPKPTPINTPIKQQIIKPAVPTSTPGKLAQLKPLNSPVQQVQQQQHQVQQIQQQQQPQQQTVIGQAILSPKTQLIKQQGAQVLQKIAQAGVTVSTGHQIVQQQVAVGANQIISTQGGQQV